MLDGQSLNSVATSGNAPVLLDVRTVMSSLYDAVLRRPADMDGLGYWSGLIESASPDGDRRAVLADVLAHFIATPEARQKLTAVLSHDPALVGDLRQAEAGRGAIRREFLAPDAGLPSALIGLGTHCYTASLLARFGSRSWSGPFDWIFSTPAMVRDCITDRFATYLDTTHYRFVPVEERPDPDFNRVEHRLFQDRYDIPAPVFNHTDAHLPEGQDYLRRCVARLETVLREGEDLRFLQIVPDRAGAADEFARTQALLADRCVRPRLVQVIVAGRSATATQPTFETLEQGAGGRLLHFRPISAWHPTRFTDLLDDLMLMRGITAAFVALG